MRKIKSKTNVGLALDSFVAEMDRRLADKAKALKEGKK